MQVQRIYNFLQRKTATFVLSVIVWFVSKSRISILIKPTLFSITKISLISKEM